MITIDGNGAVASVAFRTSEVIAIYPITPSSTMAEQADAWAGNGLKNVWGDVPRVVEMQSEAGAIGAVHGALQTGALSTSFTSSQGLLLMIPTLYKLAGQLMPFVLHVAARTVATHALSIFGDHSDVMAVRQTGCAMLCASSVQEAQDFALISHIATLQSRVPFIHFFDGFRTSHEINKIAPLADDTIRALLPQDKIAEHRQRALNPEHPVIRGTSANPDTYFQSREATNPWYDAVYDHVEKAMDDFAAATGRQYKPFEFYGHPQAERVIVIMGSAIGTCEEVVDELLSRGEKVGVLKVRLYRPFSAAHLLQFIDKYQMAERLKPGGIFLLNTPYSADEVWSRLPQEVQATLNQKKARFYVVNAAKIARECSLGARINTVMQMAFFHLTQILPGDSALAELQAAIAKSYSSKGQELVERNWQALALARESLAEVPLQPVNASSPNRPPVVSDAAPDFVKTVTAAMLAGLGDALPVSALPPDGTWPMGTTRWEKRNIAEEIPIWKEALCTQCNHCVAACPHSAIRAKVVAPEEMENAPASLHSLDVKSRDMRGQKYVLQVAPEDCTGCNLCVEVCPAKDRQNPEIKAINMMSRLEHVEEEKVNYEYFLNLPEIDRSKLERIDIRTSQLISPLFEYSGACSGCGETPYIKLLTQLYGDRMLIANATGCSSIYGGNLPSTPYTTDANGRGPAWANSLFEDNAEFGLGFRLTVDQHRQRVMRLLSEFADKLPAELNAALHAEATPEVRREQVAALRQALAGVAGAEELLTDADALVEKSVWLIGGDGWAYDIGFGGLDHVLSLTENVNILVLDTQCYSNTGGQASKATPLGAVTKFGEHGKRKARKDLGVSMMMYGHVYVAQISLGAQLNQTVKAIQEAEAYPGPSLIIAYSPCEEHGYDLALSHDQMRQLTATGFWPLYRFDPRRADEGKLPLALDSRPPSDALAETLLNEQRFRRLNAQQPEVAEQLWKDAAADLQKRYDFLAQLAGKAEKSPSEG